MPNDFPGEFEQMVLLAILRTDDAVAIRLIEVLDSTADRPVSRGALYRTLDRMEKKGWVRHRMEAGAPERGGHRRRIFAVTDEGIAVLQASRRALHRLWEGLDPVLGEIDG
jgi:DNA-binding PadR family transcriptional regulator